jgi:hypothetical protein
MHARRGSFWLMVGCVACAAIAGCGPEERDGFTITGKLTVGGAAPGADGAIPALGFAEMAASGGVGQNVYPGEFNPDGTYTATVPAGSYNVDIIVSKNGKDALNGKYRATAPDAFKKEITGDEENVNFDVTAP